MPQYRPRRTALIAGLTLCLTGCGPVTAAFHNPETLPASKQDSRVHYEPGASAYAEAVAKMLPGAMAKIEAVQGAPFGGPFLVAAYVSDGAYAAANGAHSANTNAMTYFDRITLSPRLWRDEPERLEAYLAHELSHEHLKSHLSILAFQQIPSWFLEGLAVMASDGGGAQRVSVEEARGAIKDGDIIATPDAVGLFNRLEPPAQYGGGNIYRRMHMAYRQAGMFVTYLREKNPAAFNAFLHRLLSGERFKPAFETSFGSSVAENWTQFAQATSRS
ncbi:MAG: hypothetical protein ACLPX9_04935 [Rhodomicrobium sp.]